MSLVNQINFIYNYAKLIIPPLYIIYAIGLITRIASDDGALVESNRKMTIGFVIGIFFFALGLALYPFALSVAQQLDAVRGIG